jgi:uncharacterized protein YcbK (DUF882 family)
LHAVREEILMAIYKKGDYVKLSDHFNSSEFMCSCDQCNITIIDPKLIVLLEEMRALLGTPIKINAGYRCQHKQDMLRLQGYETAKGTSTHQLGQAVDIESGVSLGHELEDAARRAGFKAVGVAATWVHLDTRGQDDGRIRRWVYKKP